MPATALVEGVRFDIWPYRRQWLAMLVVLTVFMGVEEWAPTPAGCPRGYRGAGGLSHGGSLLGLGCTAGAHRAVDLAVFGARHIYHRTAADGTALSSATCAGAYRCDVHDPEGLLGVLTACWMAFLGVQAGRALVAARAAGAAAGAGPAGARAKRAALLPRLAAWAAAPLLLGGALAGFSQEGGVVPINKNLWSLSFVLVVAGGGAAALAIVFLLVDDARVWTGSPLGEVGANSLFFYVAHETFDAFFPLRTYVTYQGFGGPRGWASHAEALASNITGVLTWVAVCRYLYLEGIFINV